MVSIATKSTGDAVSAAEFNQLPDELEQIVTDSGQTPASGTLDQVSKAVSTITANCDYYTDSGAADAYVLSVVAPNKAPQSLRNGMKVRFRTVNANTGASTVNVAGLGLTNVKKQDGVSDPDAGDISAARENIFSYDGSVFRVITELNDASETVKGIAEIATTAEAQAGVDDARIITPAKLQDVTANETRAGILEVATTAEAQAGALDTKIITPLKLQDVTATETRKGVAELATNAEVATATDTSRPIVPSALASLFAASSRSASGYMRIPVKVGTAFVEMIIQWGRNTVAGSSTHVNGTVTLPLTFPNAHLIPPVATGNTKFDGAIDATAGELILIVTHTQTTSNFAYKLDSNNTKTLSGTLAFSWVAIGY